MGGGQIEAALSYLSEGGGALLLGFVIILILPIGGIITIVLGIMMLAVGASNEQPGRHANRCSWLGHDWRTNMSAMYGGTRCRNCLRIKGQPAVVGYVPMVPGAYMAPAAYALPGYGAPVVVMPAAPSATQRAAYAPPVQQLVCPACRSPVQAGMQFCPWCNRPFG